MIVDDYGNVPAAGKGMVGECFDPRANTLSDSY